MIDIVPTKKKKAPEESIVMFKLVSGDTIIARAVGSDENLVIVKDPVMMKPSSFMINGAIHSIVQYEPWFHESVSVAYSFPKTSVISAAIPSVKLIRSYIDTIVQNTAEEKHAPKKRKRFGIKDLDLDNDLPESHPRFDIDTD